MADSRMQIYNFSLNEIKKIEINVFQIIPLLMLYLLILWGFLDCCGIWCCMNMTKKTEIFLPKTKTNFVLFNKQQSRETTFDTFIFKNCRRKLINNCISYFLDAGSLTVLRQTSSKSRETTL